MFKGGLTRAISDRDFAVWRDFVLNQQSVELELGETIFVSKSAVEIGHVNDSLQ